MGKGREEIRREFHEYYMRMAMEEAEQALKEGEIPIGAVLVFEGEVLARAHNMPISLNDPTAHAEILVLREAALKRKNYRLPHTSLYVTVEPCVMCVGALIQARVEELIFGAFDTKAGACGSVFDIPSSPEVLHKVTVVSGILEEECRKMMQGFFRTRR